MRRTKKSLWPLFILTVFIWSLLIAIIFLIDPVILKDFPVNNSYFIFFVFWFLGWFSLISLVSKSAKRGFIYSAGLTVLLILKLIRLGNVVNSILLIGLLGAVDFYLASR